MSEMPWRPGFICWLIPYISHVFQVTLFPYSSTMTKSKLSDDEWEEKFGAISSSKTSFLDEKNVSRLPTPISSQPTLWEEILQP